MEDNVNLQLRERSGDDEAEEEPTDADPFDEIMCYGTGSACLISLPWFRRPACLTWLSHCPDDTDAMLQLQKLEQVKMEVQSWISKVNPSEPDVRFLRVAMPLNIAESHSIATGVSLERMQQACISPTGAARSEAASYQ